MKKAIVGSVLAAALALSSCQSIGFGDNLQQICSNAVDAHAAFIIVASTGTVRQSLIQREAAAWATAQVICANPEKYERQAAVITLAEMYAIIISMTRSAR